MKAVTSPQRGWSKGDLLTVCGAQYVIAKDPHHMLPKRLRGRTDPVLRLKEYRHATPNESQT